MESKLKLKPIQKNIINIKRKKKHAKQTVIKQKQEKDLILVQKF